MMISLRKKLSPKYALLFIISLILLGHRNRPNDGKTNAPGEGRCTECHNSNNPNNYDGSISLTGLPASVNAGIKYSLTLTVNNPNQLALMAGFQMVVLNASNQNFGTLSNAGANSTLSGSNRRYFEHNPAVNFNNGSVSWTVDWTAPSSGTAQTVTFYAAANISNRDNTNQGDFIIYNNFSTQYVPAPDPIIIDITGENISCNGAADGSAIANVSGGVPGYTYSWSNGAATQQINNLSPGVYTVTVTDNASTTATASIQITQPAILNTNINSSGTNLDDCQITSIDLTANNAGGTQPYNYVWSTGATTQTITVIQPGTYAVTVIDANQCSAADNIEITKDPDVNIVIQEVSPPCVTDPPIALQATPSGGFFSGDGVIGDQFYPDQAGLGAHEITYSYIQGNCTFQSSITINVVDCGCSNPPTVNAGADQTICKNSSLVLNGFAVNGTPTWTSSGSGTFSDIHDPLTTYVPANGESGNIILTISIPDPDGNGPCEGAIDQMNLTIVNTQISFGFYAPFCLKDTSIQLSATPTGGSWSGPGISPNGIFNPSIAGIGTHHLIYQATDQCQTKDSLEINVVDCAGCPNPAWADAGPDIDFFCGVGSIPLAGSSNYSFSWETDGQGTLSFDSSGVLYYLPVQADIEAGQVTFTMTTIDPDGKGPCLPASDQFVVHFNLPPDYPTPGVIYEDCTAKLCFPQDPNYTIQWSDSSTGYCFQNAELGGRISAILTTSDHGCQQNFEFELQPYESLNVVITDYGDISDIGGFGYIDMEILGGLSPYEVEWYKDGNLYANDEDLDTIRMEGNYWAIITDSSGCTSYSDTIKIRRLAMKSADLNGISVYPNPAKDELHVFVENSYNTPLAISIISPLGEPIKSVKNVEKENRSISLQDIKPGMYLIIFDSGQTKYYTKLVKIE